MTGGYPQSPGFKDNDTGRLAAESMEQSAPKLRDLCLRTLADRPHGATADEVAETLNKSVLSIRPRFSELRRVGRIVYAGNRRTNSSGRLAKVWRVA